MASESSDERAVSVSLPPDVDEWLDGKAAQLGVDRETMVVQLLAAYRTAGDLDDEELGDFVPTDVESEVRDAVAERIPDIADAVRDELDGGDVTAVEDRFAAEIDATETDLRGDIDGVERDFREKIQDVRDRVIQVKREADAKADADHTHSEFDDLGSLSAELDDLDARLGEVAAGLEDRGDELTDLESRVDALEATADRLDDVEEKLQTVAWVVSDLREEVDAQTAGSTAIDRLKRSAAEADVDRAVCDSCEQPVDVALLSEPKCPHCDATVSDVELPGGLFGKPRLTVAQPLEAGTEDRADVPDAARRE